MNKVKTINNENLFCRSVQVSAPIIQHLTMCIYLSWSFGGLAMDADVQGKVKSHSLAVITAFRVSPLLCQQLGPSKSCNFVSSVIALWILLYLLDWVQSQ